MCPVFSCAGERKLDKVKFYHGILWFSAALFLVLPVFPPMPVWYDKHICNIFLDGIILQHGFNTERTFVFIFLWLLLCVIYRKYLIRFLISTVFLHWAFSSAYYNYFMYISLGYGYCEATPPDYIFHLGGIICQVPTPTQ